MRIRELTVLNFHGHTFTAEGLTPSPDKIKAVQECKPPETKEELVSFLQMLAYLSRYISNFSSRCEPLRRLTRDKVRAVTEMNHAVVLENIVAETRTDKKLQHLMHAMRNGKWNKIDPTLKPYYNPQSEIYEAEDMVLRLDKIIPPNSLREKIIRIAHKQGHLGLSKTKEMIRRKYWWPGMNIQIENLVSRCFECQITTKQSHTEPAKMTTLPERPWQSIEVDFCGPYPSGEYVLVTTDQYSRYPDVEFTTTTACPSTKKKLKKIFSTSGVPEVVQTDNGPPFNSQEFSEFSNEAGFKHKRITPLHPKAQGQVENFNKLVNKIMTMVSTEEGIGKCGNRGIL